MLFSTLKVSLLGCLLLATRSVMGVEPNYPEIDDTQSESVDAVVDISQESPNSNTIHVAHNIPKNSDITLKQTDAYNSTVHISLNIGEACKVNVDIGGAVNCQYHISFNIVKNSECNVKLDRAFNTSLHMSFQNPANTPVTLMMDSPRASQIHLSQNVPTNCPVDVSITNPVNNSIHVSQSTPKFSPLTFSMDGDASSNSWEVSQNSPDDQSTLSCTPDCPQVEYTEEDYSDYEEQVSNSETQNFGQPEASNDHLTNQQEPHALGLDVRGEPSQNLLQHNDDLTFQEYEEPSSTFSNASPAQNSLPSQHLSPKPCPGSSLEACIDVCPANPPIAFKYCVAECGERCP